MLYGTHKYTLTSNQKGKSQVGLRTLTTASYTAGFPGFSSISGLTGFGKNLRGGIVEDIAGPLDDKAIRSFCRDIYYHDPISGSYVDLLSNLPFDDFSLTDVEDPEILTIYMKSLENLKIKLLMPSLSVNYLSMGAFLGTLDWNNDTKIFENILPHNLDDCTITPMPIFGVDPVIDWTVPPSVKKLFENNKDPRISQHLQNLPQNIKDGMKKGKVSLNPLTTLYVARRCFADHPIGVSVYRRLLPIYFLEKALLRGTVESAHRRQRGILHLQVGDEEWEPTTDNLGDLANMFQQADSDPLNPIVATRQGIQAQELRAGADFWKYDDIYEMASSYKMKALGISEAFLSGDATYNNMETAMSVFMEQVRSYRSYVTKKTFYEKIFPAIAAANGFIKSDRQQVTGEVRGSVDKEQLYGLRNSRIIKTKQGKYIAVCAGDTNHDIPEIKDITKYIMPTVHWHKQLQPESDQAYMDMLTAMTEKGIPVPLRMMAAAGGLNLDKIIAGQDEDIAIREQIKEYTDKIHETEGSQGIEGGGYSQESGLFSPSVKRKGFGSRKFPETNGTKINKAGNPVPMSKRESKQVNERLNRHMSKILAEKSNNPYGEI